MARAGLRFTIVGLAAAGLLMGCVEGGGTTGAGDGSGIAAAPASKKKGAARDVEAPEVFQATDSALWDGRPSLGGIWVAAPEVTNPERVLIFNPATGKSVTGALFKRERENPGPRLQLSSDAAEALGILAGQPTEIRVTALRKVEEEAPAEPAPDEAATAVAAAGDPADPAKEGEGEAAAIASAALAAVDAEKPAADPAAAASPGDAVAGGVEAAAAAAAAGTAAVVDETPKRKTWKERRAEAKAAREAKKRAAEEAKAAAAAAAAGTGAAPAADGTTTATATAATAAVAPIESAPLDARDPAAVTAKPKAETKRKTVGQDPAPEAASEGAGEAAAPVVAAGPVRPIQVASFSKEDNAKRAAAALAKIGVTATPQKSEKGGKAVWGVIVQGDEAMLKKIKDAGFADAYFLK